MSNKRSATAVAKNKSQVKKAVELKETENIVPIKENLTISKNEAFKQTIDILRSDILSMIGMMSSNPEYTIIKEQLIQIDSNITTQLFKTYNLDLEFIPIGSVNVFLNNTIVKPLNKIKTSIFEVERDGLWNDVKNELLSLIEKTINRVLVDGKWVNFLNEKEKVDIDELNKIDPMFGRIIKARKNPSIDLKFFNDNELGPTTPRRMLEGYNEDAYSRDTYIADKKSNYILIPFEEAKALIPPLDGEYVGKLWMDSVTKKNEEKKVESTEKFLEKTEEWIDKNTKIENKDGLEIPKNEQPVKNEEPLVKYTRTLLQKWAPVLESEIGPKIKTQGVAAMIAQLLENQTKLNKGYLPESECVTKDLQRWQEYTLPLIRRCYVELRAFDLVSVLSSHTPTEIYSMYRYNKEKDCVLPITGTVICGTRQIECPTLSNFSTLNSNMPESIITEESLQGIAYDANTVIDSEIIGAMQYCATNIDIGGLVEPSLNINDDIVEKIFHHSVNIGLNTHMGDGNFVICSPDIIEKISKSKYFIGIYKYGSLFLQDPTTPFYEVGNIIKADKFIKVFNDSQAKSSYTLVGLNGKRQGYSGIQFIPYIPYYLSKKDDKVFVNTRYAIVSIVKDSGYFYRYNQYVNLPSESTLDKEENNHYSDIMKTCIKEVETLEVILLNKVDNGSVSKEKIHEIITPLYRHALLVLGFHYARGSKVQETDEAFKDKSESSLVESSLDILSKLEKLYTTDLLTDCVSVGRVHEILTPIKKHANLIMGMYSYKNKTEVKQPEYIILTELPEIGEKFSQAIEGDFTGVSIVTYHNIEIFAKMPEVGVTFVVGKGLPDRKMQMFSLSKNDLSGWKFAK